MTKMCMRDAEVGLTPSAASLLAEHHKDALTEWMDQDLRDWMGDTIPEDVRFGGQAGEVFKNLAGDFMLDALDDVDAVLATGAPQKPCRTGSFLMPLGLGTHQTPIA